MSKVDGQRFEALLEEYKTLRHEVERATQLRLTVLAFGATSWAALAAWIIANRADFYSEATLLLLHIPLIVIYVVLKAAERHVMRLSTYIREFLETEIEGLRWETRISEFQRRSRFVLSTSQISAISFLLLSVSAVLLVNLFAIRQAYAHPRWLDYSVLAPLWVWLLFWQLARVISMGSRSSERSAARLWNRVRHEEPAQPPA
jgi:hypothetical protein